jgi:hypothetical protein
MVQNGIFYAGTLRLESMLKVLLFPMFAMPNRPILSEVPGLPNLALLTNANLKVVLKLSIIIIIKSINKISKKLE